MIKNFTRIEHKIGERVFHLMCDQDSPLSEVQAALCHFMKVIGKIEDAAKQPTQCSEGCAEPKVE